MEGGEEKKNKKNKKMEREKKNLHLGDLEMSFQATVSPTR